MDFMQDMTFLTAQLSVVVGDGMQILSGCQEAGMNVTPGYVVINGEILPFAGGAKLNTVYIEETRRDVNASGYHFPQVYISRTVKFGLGATQYNWADFKPVATNEALASAIDAINQTLSGLQGLPAGIIVMWSGNPGNVPQGWALCDGLQGRPNLMGRFVVGYNQNDDDYNAIGKTGGSKQVTLSTGQMPEHVHGGVPQKMADIDRGSGNTSLFSLDNYGQTESSGQGQPHENRPPYYVLAYIIKQ
jgi:microcystin-dependent protein